MQISEFAKECGVTVKTLLHYEKIGLLMPSGRNDKGYRIYCDDDFLKLQQITTLKYTGLPLKEIGRIINDSNENLEGIIKIQKEALEEKKKHIEQVIKAFNKAQERAKENGFLDVESLINVIKITNMENTIKDQYKNDKNLNLRTNLHSYNTSGIDWDEWCFDKMELHEKSKILELGCGNGKLWVKNKDKINNSCRVVLSDFSKSILKSAENNIKENAQHIKEIFSFKQINAENIPFENESFDVVIAEHMIYFITDIEKAVSEMFRVLKKDGILYATTNSKDTMKELNELSEKFAPHSGFSENVYADRFDLENGEKCLENYFNNIEVKTLQGKIVVDKPGPVVSYKASTIQGRKVLEGENKEKFKTFLKEYIEKNGSIKISTKAGLFICKK